MADPCDSGPCPFNTTCINLDNGYDCECNEGFVYNTNQLSCVDIDECALNISNCTKNEICVNTIGSYKCICKEGYELINDLCQQITTQEPTMLTDTSITPTTESVTSDESTTSVPIEPSNFYF